MIKKYLMILSLLTPLVFTGCGVDGDTCAAKVSIDLDTENFSEVVASLEDNQTCSGSFSDEEAWLNLGAAYIGQAGISVGKILGSIAGLTNASSLGGILGAFDGASTTAGLNALTNAEKVYSYITNSITCTDTGLTDYQEAACTYTTIASTLKMVGIINASLGSFVSLIGTVVTTDSAEDVNGDGAADESQATQCAITNGTATGACGAIAAVAIAGQADVIFNDGAGFSDTFSPRTYTLTDSGVPNGGDAVFYKLLDPDAVPVAPVTTSGACTIAFATCATIDNTSCFPCPVIIDGGTLSTTTGVLDVVNNGGVDDATKATLDGDGDGTVTSTELADAMALF